MTIIRCASFDIGKKNFSFYVEEFDTSLLNDLENIELHDRYKPDGTPTEDFEKVLALVYRNGKSILLDNVDITINSPPGLKELDEEIFHTMTDVLDSHAKIWDTCNVFVIEKQMSFGKCKSNPQAVWLGHHCQSYFRFRYGRFKEVLEFPAYHKTQVLGAQKTATRINKSGTQMYKAVDKPVRKKWVVGKALEILALQDDDETIQKITNSKKKDDLSDVICQLQSFKYIAFCTDGIK